MAFKSPIVKLAEAIDESNQTVQGQIFLLNVFLVVNFHYMTLLLDKSKGEVSSQEKDLKDMEEFNAHAQPLIEACSEYPNFQKGVVYGLDQFQQMLERTIEETPEAYAEIAQGTTGEKKTAQSFQWAKNPALWLHLVRLRDWIPKLKDLVGD